MTFHQYQVVGRALPTETDVHPKIYRMKLWATNEVRAKSKFWYFLRKLKKVKKSNGQMLAINEIFEKNPTKIKNYGIWLRYQSRTGYHNMYKEYRDTTLNGAVEHMYNEMASRHRVRSPCIQIIKTATIPAKLCKRESTKHFHNSKIKFPLVFKKVRPPTRKLKTTYKATKPNLFIIFTSMAPSSAVPDEQVVVGEEIEHVRVVTLNRPRQLNAISPELVALVHGISMGGGAALMVPLKFSVVTEKTVFATPEASFGFHTDCGFSYYHSRLPGYLGEYLALTGGRLSGKEIVAVGVATHFVPSEKIVELEKRLISLNSGDENAVRSVIEEFSSEVKLDEESILNKQSIINECFSKDSLEEIIKSLEAEAYKEGNGWIDAVLKGMKRSSPTALKIALRSVREGRNQTLPECLKKEFRLTMNILRTTISKDMYEGIRALTIDKDNTPKWEPSSLDKVEDGKLDLIFQPFEKNLELQIPESEEYRWDGKYENSAYALPN
ncbi:3-hydroxyisobutyryl-CoA hydrolase-like protein 5 [Glycine soja]